MSISAYFLTPPWTIDADTVNLLTGKPRKQHEDPVPGRNRPERLLYPEQRESLQRPVTRPPFGVRVRSWLGRLGSRFSLTLALRRDRKARHLREGDSWRGSWEHRDAWSLRARRPRPGRTAAMVALAALVAITAVVVVTLVLGGGR